MAQSLDAKGGVVRAATEASIVQALSCTPQVPSPSIGLTRNQALTGFDASAHFRSCAAGVVRGNKTRVEALTDGAP